MSNSEIAGSGEGPLGIKPTTDRQALAAAAILSFTTALLLFVHWSPFESGSGSGFDSGVFAYCARALRSSGNLYRYCTDNKPPGIFLVYALADSAPKRLGVWAAIWLLAWAAISFTWIAVARLLGRELGGRAWVVALMGVFSTYAIIDGAVTVEVFSMPFQVLIAVASSRLFRRPSAMFWALAGGAASMSLFMMRANNVGASVLLALALLHWGLTANGRAMAAKYCATMVAGALAMGIVTLLLSGGIESIAGLLDFAIRQNAGYSATQQSSRAAAALSGIVWAMTLFPLMALGALASPQKIQLRDTVYRTLRDPWSRAVLVWIAFEVIFCAVSARRFPHYAQLLLVPCTLAVGHVLGKIWFPLGAKMDSPSAPTLRLVAFGVIAGFLSLAPTIRRELRYDSDDRVTRRFISHLTDEARRLGAAADGAFLWGLPPAVYVGLRSSAPVRHISPVTLATPSFSRPEFFDETVECLAGTMPAVILDGFDATVMGIHRGETEVPNLVELPGLAKIRTFVERHYTFQQRLAGTAVGVWTRAPNAGLESAGRDCRPVQGTWAFE